MGIDVGTTGCKVVAFDKGGKQLAAASAEYPLIFPRTGWIELDPEVVWRKIVRCVREVASKTKSDPVTALAVSSQGEAFVPVDVKGRSLCNSIVTFDSRAEGYMRYWKSKVGSRRVFRTTGIPLSPMATLPKIQWLMENKPTIAKQAHQYLCFEDFVVMRMGLTPSIDYSLAARTMAFDVNTLSWSSTMLKVARIHPEQLANPVPAGTALGELSARVSISLGLDKGTVIVAGGHDQPCGAFGAGVISAGEAMYATGTVECIVPVFSKPTASSVMMRNNLCSYPHIVPGKFVSLAFNFTGGSLLRWYRDTFGGDYESLVRNMSDEPSRLLTLPHFTMSGTPHFDTKAKGLIAGLLLSTKRNEITRSLLEGVTLEMKLNVELLEQAVGRIRSFRAIGGGAKSSRWMQLKADVMNRPIHAMQQSEATCLGAAMLAGIGSGVYSSEGEAVSNCVRLGKTYVPNKKNAREYTRKMHLYQQLYPAMSSILHQL